MGINLMYHSYSHNDIYSSFQISIKYFRTKNKTKI